MAAHAEEFAALAPATDTEHRLEGKIWAPSNLAPGVAPVRGLRNSSKTRVAPVFEALQLHGATAPQWIGRILDLVVGGAPCGRPWSTQDLTVESIHYEPQERPLQPPVALLSWLVRNLEVPAEAIDGNETVAAARRKLAQRDPATIERALELLRGAGTGRGWYVLEGPTYPDVFVVTPDALVVIEGKRTEGGATTSTTWMSNRHQMLRHLDAAWEIRGRRSVYGFLVVEAEPGRENQVPPTWLEAARATRSDEAIRGSLPHRSPEEQAGIVEAFLGVTTWQAIVEAFKLDTSVLVETVLPPGRPGATS